MLPTVLQTASAATLLHLCCPFPVITVNTHKEEIILSTTPTFSSPQADEIFPSVSVTYAFASRSTSAPL